MSYDKTLDGLTLTQLTQLMRDALQKLGYHIPTLNHVQDNYIRYVNANHSGHNTNMPRAFSEIPEGKLSAKMQELHTTVGEVETEQTEQTELAQGSTPEPVADVPAQQDQQESSAVTLTDDVQEAVAETPAESPEGEDLKEEVEDADESSTAETEVEDDSTEEAPPAPRLFDHVLFAGTEYLDADGKLLLDKLVSVGEPIASGDYVLAAVKYNSNGPTFESLTELSGDVDLKAELIFEGDAIVEVSKLDDFAQSIILDVGSNSNTLKTYGVLSQEDAESIALGTKTYPVVGADEMHVDGEDTPSTDNTPDPE